MKASLLTALAITVLSVPAASEVSAQTRPDLVQACGAKGWQPDFATGDCINPEDPTERARPRDLSPDFQDPTPPAPDLVFQCGRLGKVPDFATGKCR